VIGNNHKGETLYRWGECCDWVWKGFGDKETHPVYKGDVKNGKPNGLGIMNYPNGSKYVGESKYVGSWKDGKEHGQGTFTFTDGIKWAGEFRVNKPWNLSLFDKKGNINIKWINGKKQ